MKNIIQFCFRLLCCLYFLFCLVLFVIFSIEGAETVIGGRGMAALIILWPLFGMIGLFSYYLYETGSRQWRLIIPMMSLGLIAAIPAVAVLPMIFSMVVFGNDVESGVISFIPSILLSAVPLILVMKALIIFYSIWKQKSKKPNNNRSCFVLKNNV